MLFFSASLYPSSKFLDFTNVNKNDYLIDNSFNSFGQVGLIQIPSAESKPEGTISFILNKNDMWKVGTLTVSPFDWLEASYFYYRPSDLRWSGNNRKGHYLDKGFNVKFIYRPKNYSLPNIAIGLDDFAGTGYFTKEYIVATKKINKFKITLGNGWGNFAGENSYTNPLSFVSESFKFRPNLSDRLSMGGTLAYDKWFRGDAALFGGFEFEVPKISGLKFKIETDPFNYLNFSALNRKDANLLIRQKESDLNFGLSFNPNNNLSINLSYIKGNLLNLSFAYGITFNNKISKKPKFSPYIVKTNNKEISSESFYLDLLNNLNNNKLLLQTANLDKKGNLDISISTSDHRSAIRSSSYASFIANEVALDNNVNLSMINVSHLNTGVELNNISYVADNFNKNNKTPIEVKIRNTQLGPGDSNKFKQHEFQPKVNFPVIFSSSSPSLITHIGNPEKFYFGGLNLQNISEIQFSRNLILSSEINLRIYDNFQDTISGPGSEMEHVRTDLVQYLKEDDIYITRLQFDYIWSPYKNMYAKVSSGIFESMYGGDGGEFLYKPFNKNFTFGAELFNVKQRSFDQRFDFREYKTTTGHIKFGYLFAAGVEANLSFGRYLAKDDGYTFDLGRRTNSGFKAGIYFTRTNVSSELFGEGSFDKGFYFQIPLDLLSNEYKGNYTSLKISPLTRDGGAKLIHDKDLNGLIHNSTRLELINQWRDYLD